MINATGRWSVNAGSHAGAQQPATDKPNKRRFPAEWEPQSGVMLTWPQPDGPWEEHYAAVEACFTAIATAIRRHEALLIIGRDSRQQAQIAANLKAEKTPPNDHPVVFAQAPANDCWSRDHGPLTVWVDGEPHLLDFRFNAWGGKYPFADDDAITRNVHAAGHFGAVPLEPVPLVLEGGAIDTDGQGSLLATRHCVLSPSRNPGLNQTDLETALSEKLGIKHFHWLAHGRLLGDDTDGHIDTLARFCSLDTIAYTACEDPDDPHYAPLQAMASELQALRRTDGSAYRLVPLPLPAPCYAEAGSRLPATYANFLIINQAVLVPVYNDPNDTIACERLAALFPDRAIIAIDCQPLIHQYGSLHCVTMQLPSGVIESCASP